MHTIKESLSGLVTGIDLIGHWGSKVPVSRADLNPDCRQQGLTPIQGAVALNRSGHPQGTATL